MNEAVIKEEVIEETCNFTFKNGEYVEVKQEKIEQKPEYLLENEIKTETNEFLNGVVLKPNEINSKNLRIKFSMLKCEVCQETMPRYRLKLITSEVDKTVLSEIFKVKGCLKTRMPHVCLLHIQTIIDDYDGKLKLASTPFEKDLRSFISKNKIFIKASKTSRTPDRRKCHVCHITKNRSELYQITSNGIRAVIMVGCILRGTHSTGQANSYITTSKGFACYSHCKESIDMIFEYLGVRNIQEFLKCSTLAMSGLMEIVKSFDPNLTVDQFMHAFNMLSFKSQKFPTNL